MTAVLITIGMAVATTPLLVPAEYRLGRFCVALFAGTIVMKLWDVHIGARRGQRPHLRELLAFFANILSPVLRMQGLERQPGRAANLRELGRNALAMVAVIAAADIMFTRVDWTHVPFLVEHAFKGMAGFLLGVSLFHVAAAAVRLAGGYVLTPTNAPLVARTPAEFWRRYNRLVGQFLHEDVFKPFNGRRRPVLATLLVFAVSGVLHEYLLAMAVGRVQGLQMTFFLVQGIAVVLTMRLRPKGAAAVVGQGATFAFNMVSSVFFFVSCDAVFTIYQGAMPGWLRALQ